MYNPDGIEIKEVEEMKESHPIRIYGAWLYNVPVGEDTIESLEAVPGGVPGDDWRLLKMVPGRFSECPKVLTPQKGQVTLLGQGEHMIAVTPEA